MRLLNGWQRLWVVGVVGWALVVAVVATLAWSPPQLGEEGGLPPPAPRRSMIEQSNDPITENRSPSTARVNVPSELIGGPRDRVVTVEVSATSDAEEMRDEALRKARERLATDQRHELEHETLIQRRLQQHVLAAVIWWLVPVVVLSCTGVAVAWVRRGFRNSS